jgi:hypothetical protein
MCHEQPRYRRQPQARLHGSQAGRQYLGLLGGVPQRRESQGIFEVEDRIVDAFAIMTMCEYVISW